MNRPFKAVLHCTATEFEKVNVLAGRVINGLTDNDGVFAGPNPTIAELTTEKATLVELIDEASNGDHETLESRNDQSAKVHDMLSTEAGYVNSVAKGDKVTILLSGFDASNEPTPQPIPDKVVIKRIEDGPTSQSAKVFIESLGQPRLTYIVQVTTVANAPVNDPSWKTVLQIQDSKKLVLTNLVRGTEIFIRINASNAHGSGLWSESTPFIPR